MHEHRETTLSSWTRGIFSLALLGVMVFTAALGSPLAVFKGLAVGNWLGAQVASAAAASEWTQEAHDAQRTGYTAEEPAEPWTQAWTWNGPDANGGTGGHTYNAPKDARTVTGGNNIYVPAGAMGLYALRKSDGSQAWRLTATTFNATPAYDPASGAVFAGGADGNLYKIDSNSGSVLGTYPAGNGLNKAVMLVGSSAYMLTDSGQLHKVNTADMSRAWVYAAGSNTSTPAAYSAKAGLVIFCTADLYVHAVRDADGAAQWRVKPTSHTAQAPYTFVGYWPVVAEQHGVVFVRLTLAADTLWSGPLQGTSGGGVYPLTNADTRALLLSNNGALQNLFALDLNDGSQKFVPAVGYGGVEYKTSGGVFDIQSGPAPVVKVNADGSEVAYLPFRSGQGNVPDGRWDSHMGEMALDGTTVPGLAAGDLRFVDFPNSYSNITDEQTPYTMAGNTLFHAHWGASESATILDRSAAKGLTPATPITSQGHPAVIRRQQSCSSFNPATHQTTCGLTLYGDGRYWNGPGFWVYWNTMDPPTVAGSAYSDGLLPRYTYVSGGLIVVEGNGGDLSVFRTSGGAATATATPAPTTRPSSTPTSGATSLPTSTALPTATKTQTPLPPTATNTATPLPPTATKTATTPPPTATSTIQPTSTNTPLPSATWTATALPTLAPTATRTPTSPATATTAPTAAPTQPSGSLTLKTYADFSPVCSAQANTHVSDLNGGSVLLAAANADHFDASSLSTALWSSGSWSGGSYTPTQANSLLTATGSGYVRSKATYTHGMLETMAQFGSGAWEHIGFGSDGFTGNRYFLFSTYSGDGNLYARVNNNASEQQVKLGPIPTGLHRYRIEWTAVNATTDSLAFFLDGAQVASFSVNNAGASNFYLYLSNSGSANLVVDQAQEAPAYVASGSYTSCALDAGAGSAWQSLAWSQALPANTGLALQARTSADGTTWNGWSSLAASGSALTSPARFVQFQANLTTADTAASPALTGITLSKSGSGPTATATSVPPTATNTPLPTSTRTPLPTSTNTPLPTSTNTPLPTSTKTPLPTSTNTPLPTSTNTQPPTATRTPPPTSTRTPLPTATKTRAVKPTRTPLVTSTKTSAPTSTRTPLPTSTNTPLPTATWTTIPTSTNTPLPTATMLPTATKTATAIPTGAPTATSTASPAPSATPTASPAPGRISSVQALSGSPAVNDKFEVQFSVQTSATNLDMPYDPNPPAGVQAGIGVSVNALFSADNWKTSLTQPGFLNQPYVHTVVNGKDHFTPSGAPVWDVRFAVQQAGAWQYRLSVQDSQGISYYPDLGQPALSFTAGATSSNPFAAKGILKVSPTDSRYFQFQNGTPFVGVGFNDGFSDSASVEQKMTSYQQNQMNFMRVWMSGSGINGSQWTSWASNFLPQDGYLPGTSFDIANTYNGGPVSMRLDDAGPCLYADFWQGGVPVEPNTTYQVWARVKVNAVSGPAAAGDYGFVIKQGGWLTTDCVKSGTGTRITAPVAGTSGWITVSGTYTTGSSDKWLGNLYLARENATGGQVYVDEARMWRNGDPAQVNLLRQPYANTIEHFSPMNAAQWDLYIQSAEQHGVYLKLVIDEKNEWIRDHMTANGTMTATGSNDNFYAAPGTKVRWLEQAWWRYIIARWGYSTAIHSFEYINEGDPYDGHLYEAADAMAKYFHQNDPAHHMVTTSFWAAFPNKEFWSNPQYSSLDYADLHAYISTGWGLDASFLPQSMIETRPGYVHSGTASAKISGASGSSTTMVPRGLVIQGPGEWVITYWMKAEGLTATCPYSGSGSMLRIRWQLDGGPYNGGREGVLPANSESKDFLCTSPAGTFDWKQFTSTGDRDGNLLPASARIILTDSQPHELNLLLENSNGTGGTAWIDDVQIVSPAGKVQPVIGQFDTTPMDTDTAWYNQAYAQVFGGGSMVGAHKPLVRGETGVDFVGNQNYNQDLLKDTQGIWLHNNVWGQINAGGMYDLFWWATETIPTSIYSNYLTFQNFMAGIPLANGRYQELLAQTSNAQLRALGQRDDVDGLMHLWIQNTQHNWKQVVNGPAISAVNGTVTIPNVTAGSYRVEWWNTYAASNPVFLTQTLTSNGSLVLTLPAALADDVAVKITKLP